MTSWQELNAKSDDELEQIIEKYNAQVDIVNADHESISELKKKSKLTKQEKEELTYLQQQLIQDEEDLKAWSEDADRAEQILEDRQASKPRQVQKTTLTRQTATTTKPTMYKTKNVQVPQATAHQRTIYINLINKNLTGLNEKQRNEAIEKIKISWGKQDMKNTYFYFKALSAKKAPATKEINAEEQKVLQPTTEEIKNFQQFITYNVYPQPSSSGDPIVVPKPPKEVSQPVQKHLSSETTQTAQTQTVVPLNAFKMIEKNNQKYLEPINPLKAEEISRIKKSVRSVVLLDPNRYERKPYVIRSHRYFN